MRKRVQLSLGAVALMMALVPASAAMPAEAAPTPSPNAANAILDRMWKNEQALLARMRRLRPRIETYLQNFRPDTQGTEMPYSDRYFLGRLIWHGPDPESVSFIPDATPAWLSGLGPIGGNLAAPLAHLFKLNYGGRNNFVAMLFPDVAHFNRRFYQFRYLRREFLGQVRCYVFDVAPRSPRMHGFWGRIWIEDRGDQLVRFNGSYYRPFTTRYDLHFDSWRENVASRLWIPFFVYSQETHLDYGFTQHTRFRAQTRLWGYDLRFAGGQEAITAIHVAGPEVSDPLAQSHLESPVASYRLWQRQAEDNALNRLEQAGLLAPPGAVDQVLDTVVNNLIVTNHLSIDPPVRCRVLLTTPLESMAIGHTIVLSRGMIDTLPDEASLAAILAHELGHIALGQPIDSEYAFADEMLFPDRDIFAAIHLRRPQWQEQAADRRALELLKNSPYRADLAKAGLYLRALAQEGRETHLVGSHLSNGFFVDGYLDRLSELIPGAPPLEPRNIQQIAALPLGAWVRLDPWTDQITLETAPRPALLSAGEKMPFEVTPLIPYLTRMPEATASVAGPAR